MSVARRPLGCQTWMTPRRCCWWATTATATAAAAAAAAPARWLRRHSRDEESHRDRGSGRRSAATRTSWPVNSTHRNPPSAAWSTSDTSIRLRPISLLCLFSLAVNGILRHCRHLRIYKMSITDFLFSHPSMHTGTLYSWNWALDDASGACMYTQSPLIQHFMILVQNREILYICVP